VDSGGEKMKSLSESLAQTEFLKLFSGWFIAFEGFVGYFFVYPLNLLNNNCKLVRLLKIDTNLDAIKYIQNQNKKSLMRKMLSCNY
jgi:hypothetical protein